MKLLISFILFLLPVFILAQDQTDGDLDRILDHRNPLLEISSNVSKKDTVPFDSLLYFARRVDVYLPRFTEAMFIVVGTTDDIHHFIYRRDEGHPKNFIRLNLPINSLAFDVSGFELYSESPQNEIYFITCKVSESYFYYEYDLIKNTLTTDSTYQGGY